MTLTFLASSFTHGACVLLPIFQALHRRLLCPRLSSGTLPESVARATPPTRKGLLVERIEKNSKDEKRWETIRQVKSMGASCCSSVRTASSVPSRIHVEPSARTCGNDLQCKLFTNDMRKIRRGTSWYYGTELCVGSSPMASAIAASTAPLQPSKRAQWLFQDIARYLKIDKWFSIKGFLLHLEALCLWLPLNLSVALSSPGRLCYCRM